LSGATNQMVSLWIDLVRQAFPSAAQPPTTVAAAGLTPRQLNALDCVSQEGITMTQLARALRVTESCATALADHLFVAGAISRERDSVDRRLVRVSMTEAGSALAASYRRDLEAGLLQLLSQLAPAKLTAVTLAMTQLGDRDQSGPGSPWANEAVPNLARGTASEQLLDDA
jgi:DNA-binding MarR family transcriptional regulator